MKNLNKFPDWSEYAAFREGLYDIQPNVSVYNSGSDYAVIYNKDDVNKAEVFKMPTSSGMGETYSRVYTVSKNNGIGQTYTLTAEDLTNFSANQNNIFLKVCQGVRYIGDGTNQILIYDNARRVNHMLIPPSVERIESNALKSMFISNLYIYDLQRWFNITFVAENSAPFYTVSQQSTYYGANLYLNGNIVNKLVMPDSKQTVRAYSFYGCKSIITFDMNSIEKTKYIEQYAFAKCQNLSEVINSSHLYSIGGHAFDGCEKLRSIHPGMLRTIGEYAFSQCNSLREFNFDNYYLTSIGDYAFSGTNLETVVIPSRVTSFGKGVFSSCYALKSVTLPDNITSIGDYTFHNCYSLTDVKLSDNTTTIGEYAFYDCNNLLEIVLPSTITTIKKYAFYRYNSATLSVTLLSTTPPTIEEFTFPKAYPYLVDFYVPEESVNAYKSAPFWSNFADRIKPIQS